MRNLSYVLVVIFVAVGTFILTRYTQGFEIDPASRSLVQNGLVLIESEPVEAAVFIDNKDSGEQTPSRITLPIGEHNIRLQAAGYRTWNKSFEIEGSDLIWMNYPLLIPETIETSKEAVFAKRPVTALSRNRRVLAVAQPDTKVLTIYNIQNDDITEKELRLPTAFLNTLKNHTLTRLTFAADDQYLLAEFTKGKETVFSVLNREDLSGSSILDTTFELDFSNMQFDSGDKDQLYGLVDTTLYRIERNNPDSSEIIAEDIMAFHSNANALSVVQSKDIENATTTRYGYINNDEKLTLFKDQLGKGPYTIAHGSHEGNESVAISDAETTRVYENVGSRTTTLRTIDSKSDQLSFTGDGRFLVAKSGANNTVLDFEFDKRFAFSFEGKTVSDVRWIDDTHLSMVIDGMSYITEYDGENTQLITEADPVMIPLTNSNSENYFSIAKSAKRFILQRSSLVVE